MKVDRPLQSPNCPQDMGNSIDIGVINDFEIKCHWCKKRC